LRVLKWWGKIRRGLWKGSKDGAEEFVEGEEDKALKKIGYPDLAEGTLQGVIEAPESDVTLGSKDVESGAVTLRPINATLL
jgi:hypothetical protein